jgi:hypothetical protein
VAFAEQRAAEGDQGHSAEAEVFGPEHGPNDHVTACSNLPIHLNLDAVAQVVHHEHLLRLG